jgi:hypothetical protein
MKYSEDENDHEHYVFFRSLLQDKYEKEIDQMLNETIVTFEQVCVRAHARAVFVPGLASYMCRALLHASPLTYTSRFC